MKKAVITGITGQDGSYLAEFLLEKGYEVHGLMRRHSTINTERIDHLLNDNNINGKKLFMHYADMTDSSGLISLMSKIVPDEVYNLAAQSHVGISFEIPEYTAEATGVATLKILEAVRLANPKCRFHFRAFRRNPRDGSPEREDSLLSQEPLRCCEALFLLDYR